MSDLGWLGLAFAIVWLIIGLYLVRIWVAQRTIDRRLDELQKRTPPGS